MLFSAKYKVVKWDDGLYYNEHACFYIQIFTHH